MLRALVSSHLASVKHIVKTAGDRINTATIKMKTNKRKRRRISLCWDSSTQRGLSRIEQLEQSLFFMRIELDREALEIEILRSEGKLIEDRVPKPWPYDFPRFNPTRHHHTSVCGKVMLITSEEVYIQCRLAGMTIYHK